MRHPSRNARKCDVCVVGAGISGLRAACQLAAGGAEVLVLEASDRVGGRLLTEHGEDGHFIDHGGQYISSGQPRVVSLAEELGISLFPSWSEGLQVSWRDGRRLVGAGLIVDGERNAEAEVHAAAAQLAGMAQAVPLDAPWESPNAATWDGVTIASWLADNVRSVQARTVLATAIAGVFARNAQPISLLSALFWARSGDPLVPFLQPEPGPERRIVGGAQELCLRMAQRLGERVLLNECVDAIAQNDRGVRLFAGDTEVNARHAIVALPPPLAGRLAYSPALPALRDHLCQRVAMRWVVKIHCVYRDRFWAADGLSGGVAADAGTVRLVADNSPPGGSPGVLVGFIEETEALHWRRKDENARRSEVIIDLERYFGREARAVTQYREADWSDDPFCRGVEGGYWAPGIWTAYGAAIRAPCGLIHWAGTETSAIWNGKMEGALHAAERVVAEIAATPS